MASGSGLLIYLSRIARGVELRDPLASRPLPNAGSRVFYCYRNQDVLALALTLCLPEAEKHFQGVDFICDDSFSGGVVASLTSGLGRRIRILTRSSFRERVRDLRVLMQTNASIGIALDTGGPYGRVDPALPRLAQRCAARLVPLVALTSRSVQFWSEPVLRLPLPRTALTLAAGEPVEAEAADVLEGLQASLEHADAEARRQLATGRSTSPP
jgi:lysophospholipid acyltransferase (LPLAT)-like uncharacterized protein